MGVVTEREVALELPDVRDPKLIQHCAKLCVSYNLSAQQLADKVEGMLGTIRMWGALMISIAIGLQVPWIVALNGFAGLALSPARRGPRPALPPPAPRGMPAPGAARPSTASVTRPDS